MPLEVVLLDLVELCVAQRPPQPAPLEQRLCQLRRRRCGSEDALDEIGHFVLATDPHTKLACGQQNCLAPARIVQVRRDLAPALVFVIVGCQCAGGEVFLERQVQKAVGIRAAFGQQATVLLDIVEERGGGVRLAHAAPTLGFGQHRQQHVGGRSGQALLLHPQRQVTKQREGQARVGQIE